MTLNELSNLTHNGLFAFINDNDKKVYVSHSKNMLYTLYGHLERFRVKGHECRDLQDDYYKNLLRLEILETDIRNDIDRRLKGEDYKRKFVSLGYNLYKQKRFITLTPIIKIETIGKQAYKACLYLRLDNNKKILVGIFEKYKEAVNFKKEHYSRLPITQLIYCKNTLTINYYRSYNSDICTEIEMYGK